MKYKRLGSTGLVVSRVSLGMMSCYGSPGWQAWVLPKQEARRFVQQALDAGVNTFDTADFYSIGSSERARRRHSTISACDMKWCWQARSACRCRPLRTAAACRKRNTCWPVWTPRCGGCAPTTSTCTSFIGSIPTPRSTKRSMPWTSPRTRGQSPLCGRLQQYRPDRTGGLCQPMAARAAAGFDAGSVQPAVPRRRARHAALPGQRHWRDRLQPLGQGMAHSQSPASCS